MLKEIRRLKWKLNGGESLITIIYDKMKAVLIKFGFWIRQGKTKNLAHSETGNHLICMSQIYGSVDTQNILDC
jgi:hypothetical protein